MDYAIGIMIRRRVTAGAIIRNSSDQILLQRCSDDGFSLPGGGIGRYCVSRGKMMLRLVLASIVILSGIALVILEKQQKT
jgi:hypothetical protein